MASRSGIDLGYLQRGVVAVSMAVLMFSAGLLALPSTARAYQLCQQDAIAFGSDTSDGEVCDPPSDVTSNSTTVSNDIGSFGSFAAAWARAENDGGSPTGGVTYAESYNFNSPQSASLSGNDVTFSNVAGPKLNNSIAFGSSTNIDSFLSLAGAYSRLYVANVGSSDGFLNGVIEATTTNGNCFVCEGVALNNVTVSDISTPGGVVYGSIYANAKNSDAQFSAANAVNNVKISNVFAPGWILDSGDGTFALASNSGGFNVSDCVACYATAYNSLEIKDSEGGSSFMQAAQASAENTYSSGSSAVSVNVAKISNVEAWQTLALYSVRGSGENYWSPDSTAIGINAVLIGGPFSNIDVGNISQGDISANAGNYYCETCTAGALNAIAVLGDITATNSIFGHGAYAEAYNESNLQAPGFGDNTALAGNVVLLHDIDAGSDAQQGSVDAQIIGGDIISGAVFSHAANYVGEESGSCYECVALAGNLLVIADAYSGYTMIDTSVYADAENYDSYDVLAKSTNKLIIKDVSAGQSIIAPDMIFAVAPTGVFAYSTNRYCDDCKAIADNSVLIKDTFTGGVVLNGSAYAWAENNLDDSLINALVDGSGGSDNTAVAYNTLIIKDNGSLDPDALDAIAIVAADVYSCASNNVGGDACRFKKRETCSVDVVSLCSLDGPNVSDYNGSCVNCHASADNFVKITNDSGIDSGASEQNSISTGGVYAKAENTAQGEGEGICEDCTAKATNTVVATNGSLVNGPTSSDALNQNSSDSSASSENILYLKNNSEGHAESIASNVNSTDSSAMALNAAAASNGSSVQSLVSATNNHSSDSATIGLGFTGAANGGNAQNEVSASTGGTSQPSTSGVAIAVGVANANGTNAITTSKADLTNDGTSTGYAVSASYDTNGNVAVAVVFTNNGTGVAVSYGNAVNGSATAISTADGTAPQGGDVSYQDGTPTSSTSTSP